MLALAAAAVLALAAAAELALAAELAGVLLAGVLLLAVVLAAALISRVRGREGASCMGRGAPRGTPATVGDGGCNRR